MLGWSLTYLSRVDAPKNLLLKKPRREVPLNDNIITYLKAHKHRNKDWNLEVMQFQKLDRVNPVLRIPILGSRST